jgi:dTDP-4-amino-4,6-dideoxygalactose transaminase|tara:strand:- start:1691 stop:2830 length:1140 start_codon:yes stop_codon:yes gene_type:complete
VKIPFNKPWFTGKEIQNITGAASFGHISGNGIYTKKCHSFFEDTYGFKKTFLTTSCTDAIEMASLLMDLNEGDEVIMPSYTFVSTTSPFILRGAKIVFADSLNNHPNIDLDNVENLITKKTKVLLVMHYGGVSVDMDKALELCQKYDLILVEDAAHSIDSYYKGKPLGSFGDFATFSFHETKNINSGEGGLLVINDSKNIKRAEIVWEKGTNRSEFSRGEVDKYEWVDVGGSYSPSEIIAAFLYAQLTHIKDIQKTRKDIWERYYLNLFPLAEKGLIQIIKLPEFATNNGHLFYILAKDKKQRDELLDYLNNNMVHAVFHYLPLHSSPYYSTYHDGRMLPNTDKFADTLIRLPLFYELPLDIVDMICQKVEEFFTLKGK